ncbi:uncharacterized protein LTR77_002140 [Saxophila tyrrhenica]|uniref:Ribonuclease P protein subunit n=1 Tax=Saxophila tyrrhenica TaxID=1690608 RepID=A0AAV9PHQ8_9PEZI|nr:hypothetical protein LTR77_002140 [Saxophila tyrrhenica]
MAGQPVKDPSIAEALLQRAHPLEAANTIFRERVKQRPLLLRPSSPDPNRDSRSKRQYERLQKEKARRKSKKPKPLSAKQKRALCLYEIPKEQQNSGDDGKPGRTYVDAASAGPILSSADYHGALVEVVRSRCASRVGLVGIVVKDTKFTFELVTRKDVLKTVPKEHTVFRFSISFEGEGATGGSSEEASERRPLVFEIYGSQFETRAPDRANKKFRLHLDPDL